MTCHGAGSVFGLIWLGLGMHPVGNGIYVRAAMWSIHDVPSFSDVSVF